MSAPVAPMLLTSYKQAIDDDIESYSVYLRDSTRQQYGQFVAEAEVDIFLDILSRGGKRIRGALVMAGYEMCGGTNHQMILQAARAIEMIHAYLLIIDDIQDRSALRRGKPSAHEMLITYHREHELKGDAVHAGVSLALGAAGSGVAAAMAILSNLEVEPQLKLNALSITNRTVAITYHGQTLDILNELVEEPPEADIESVLEWKTALYTVINPLHVGMVLAGADCRATDAITPFGLHAGKAFQIIDDIDGIFGDSKDTGKTPGDDIREGKGTLLVFYALKHAVTTDKTFLQKALGNPKLTAEDFKKCQQIIRKSGALDHARRLALKHLDNALASLDESRGLWSKEGTIFLKGLVRTLQGRIA